MPSADGTEARKTLNTNPCLCSPVVPRRHVGAAFSNEKRTRDNKTMALSQCLDDSPAKWPLKRGNHNHLNLQELYNERHRLALEELVSGGVENFLEFLRKERIPNFLSDDEMQRIAGAAVLPPRYSSFLHGDELEQSVSASMDCSSVTYFPEVSDVEPPPLENGWPAFTTGSYRGVTRAVAHFQPSYGEVIYSCKEAARRMIKSAKELIAIVTDGLTDLDIFKDLQEACTQRKVPIYILLDHSCAPAFLKMCRDISVGLGELPLMQVRTITGGTYFMRSGAKITGKVHERFMLIDGNRVATGSYRFNWTDGKLNSSNLIELSGQVTENFDEEFRVLYAQSVPISARGPPSARNSGIFGHLLIKHPLTSSPLRARDRPIEAACLPSTPSRKPPAPEEQPPCDPLTGEKGQKSSPVSNSSTIGEDWAEPGAQEEILAGSTQCFPTGGAPAAGEPVSAPALSCHVSTQTTRSTVDTDVQTDPESVPRRADPLHSDHLASGTQDQPSPSSGSSSISPGRRSAHHHPPSVRCRSVGPENNLRDCFHKLTRERQQHYSTIRTKLEHMVTVLSQGRELVDVTNTAVGPGRGRGCKAQRETGQGQNPGLLVQSAGMGTWPKARCLH